MYCEFDLGGEGFGSHPVGGLTPVHTQTDRQLLTLYFTWVVRGLGVTLLEASHLYTHRQTDRQVLTLYCEFDLGGEGFGSHPVGGLTPVHTQTDRQLLTLLFTWVVRGLGVTLLEASHLYTDIQTDRQVLTLYCEFDLGGEGFGSHPVGGLTPVHTQTDRQLLTLYFTWVVRGLGVTLLEASHLYTDIQTDRQVLTLYCEFDLGGEGFGSHPVGGLTPVHTQTDRRVHTLYCEFDLGGKGVWESPCWRPHTCTQTYRQTDRYLHCTVSLTWVVRGLGVTLLEASHLYTASLSFGRTVKTSSFSALPNPLS